MKKRSTSWRPLGVVGVAGLVASGLLWGCGGGSDSNAQYDAYIKSCLQSTSSGGVVVGSGVPGDPAIPEPQSGYKTGKVAVTGRNFMAVTANPLASQAACEVMRDGGSAADAMVAAQMVL